MGFIERSTTITKKITKTKRPAPAKTKSSPGASKLKTLIHTTLDNSKAEDIASINLAGKSDFADFMLVATGRSAKHVSSIADTLLSTLKAAGYPATAEGLETGDWVLVDTGDIVIHLFRPEIRTLYNLEKMWSVSVPAAPLELAKFD